MRRQGGAEVEEGGGQISKGETRGDEGDVGDPSRECRSRDISMSSIKLKATTTIRIHWLSQVLLHFCSAYSETAAPCIDS